MDPEQEWHQEGTTGGSCSSGLVENERSQGGGERMDSGGTLGVESGGMESQWMWDQDREAVGEVALSGTGGEAPTGWCPARTVPSAVAAAPPQMPRWPLDRQVWSSPGALVTVGLPGIRRRDRLWRDRRWSRKLAQGHTEWQGRSHGVTSRWRRGTAATPCPARGIFPKCQHAALPHGPGRCGLRSDPKSPGSSSLPLSEDQSPTNPEHPLLRRAEGSSRSSLCSSRPSRRPTSQHGPAPAGPPPPQPPGHPTPELVTSRAAERAATSMGTTGDAGG